VVFNDRKIIEQGHRFKRLHVSSYNCEHDLSIAGIFSIEKKTN